MNERKEYLLKVALLYLKEIAASEESDALSNQVMYDGAMCDGECLINDIENAL